MLRAVVAAAPDGILIVDAAGRIRLVNAEASRLFGYVREELLGQRVDMLVPDRFAKGHETHRRRYMAAPRKLHMGESRELAARRKDGSELPIEISLSPLEDGKGSVVAIIRDVSAKRAAMANLHDRELRLRALFDHTFQFIGLLSPDGTLLEANETALAFIGCARADVIGKPFWETPWWTQGGPELPIRLQAAIADASRGHFVRFETEHHSANGGAVTIDFSLTPVRDPAGQIVYLIPEGRDITERKQLERIREEYVGVISHDLRNPLNNIAMRAEILEAALAEHPELTHHVRAIAESTQRIASMIDQLLDMARHESGRARLQFESIDMRALVCHVVADCFPPRDGARVSVSLPDTTVVARAEPAAIERVLANLISNAIKYTPPDTRIGVELARKGSICTIAVSDAGPGIWRSAACSRSIIAPRRQSERLAGSASAFTSVD